MNFKPILLLSVLFQKKDFSRLEKIQSLNHDIALLKMERWRLQKEILFQSKTTVMKHLKYCYCEFTDPKNTLPIFL